MGIERCVWSFLGAILAVGCRQLYGLNDVAADALAREVDANAHDGSLDVGLDGPAAGLVDGSVDVTMPDAWSCFGSLATVCFDPDAVPEAITLSGTIDTSADVRCIVVLQASGPELCVIAGGTVQVSASTNAHGARPLVLVATTTLSVDASLDGTSERLGFAGPGSESCSSSDGEPANTALGAGGGGGGSFGGTGGTGGSGYMGGAGGAAAMTTPVSSVRGGCAGGQGGAGTGAKAGGGAGGGALYLIAGTQLTIASTGSVIAGGAGGSGATLRGGGGAGGSGGMIALEAPAIDVSGMIAANGGGGGEGASPNSSGFPGADGLPSALPASGGAGGTMRGGDGGPGSAGSTLTGGSGSPGMYVSFDGGGGGGGGGGAGVIWVKGVVTGTSFSPPASMQ